MAKMFQVFQGDAGFSYNGQNYQFSDFDVINYTFSEENDLTRGANGQNKVGIAFKTNLKVADMAETTVKDCSVAIYNLIQDLFKNQSRISFWFVDRTTGEGITYENAIIAKRPLQTAIGESEDTISFLFSIKSFDLKPKFNDE